MVLGIDEVGRGCWAGPLVAGAVVLGKSIKGLRDSKKLSKTSRIILAQEIYQTAKAHGLGWVWPHELDAHGLSWAVQTAMRRALADAMVPGGGSIDCIIIDGNINYLPDVAGTQAIIRADDSVPAVSAASIIAKVARDQYMANLGPAYAGYGFERHVGYGTRHHIDALARLGLTDIHRKSFKPIQAYAQ